MKGFDSIPARLRRTAVLTAFFAFPLFLALFGSRLLFIDLESKLRTESENLLDEAISKIESGKDPTEHFSRLFNRVERKIFSAKDPLPILREVTVYLKNRFENRVEFVFVDGTGNTLSWGSPQERVSGGPLPARSLGGVFREPLPAFADRPGPKLIIKKFFESYKSFLV